MSEYRDARGCLSIVTPEYCGVKVLGCQSIVTSEYWDVRILECRSSTCMLKYRDVVNSTTSEPRTAIGVPY